MSGTTVSSLELIQLIEAAMPYLEIGAAKGVSAAGKLAVSVKKIIEMQAAAALRHQEQERSKLAEWVVFQQNQLRQMAEFQGVEAAFLESEKRLAKVDLVAHHSLQTKSVGGSPEAPSAKNYMALGKDRVTPSQVAEMLNDLREVIAALPQEIREADNSPYQRIGKALRDLGCQIQWR